MLSMRAKPHDMLERRRFPAQAPILRMFLPGFFLALTVLGGTAYPAGAIRPTAGASSASEPAIVIGFVGGFVHSDDTRHAEVQLAEKLRSGYSGRAHVGIFENHRGEEAYNTVLKWLDNDGNGLSESEKQHARIILYGHSWGASAVVELARELQKQRIPVLLTIQVDSITKRGQDDRVIPSNVKRAVNFYQAAGMLHGVPQIVPADPQQTQILGDYRFDYKKEPPSCSTYPWFARHFLRGHIAIECDPAVWSRIETLIGEYLLPADIQNQN